MWPALARWWPQVVYHSFGLVLCFLEECTHVERCDLGKYTRDAWQVRKARSAPLSAEVRALVAEKATDNRQKESAPDNYYVARHNSAINDHDNSGVSSRSRASETNHPCTSADAADPADHSGSRSVLLPSLPLSALGSSGHRFHHMPLLLSPSHRDHGRSAHKPCQVVRVEFTSASSAHRNSSRAG